MSNLSKRLEQQTQAALKYYKEEREKAQQQAYNAPSAVQPRGQQSGQIVSRLDNSINSPSVQRQRNQQSAQIASRLDNSNLAQMQNSGLSRLKQLREEALEEERPRRGGASDQYAQLYEQMKGRYGEQVDQWLEAQERGAFAPGGGFGSNEENHAAKQPWYKTAFDTVGWGAGQFNQGTASMLDFAANAIPRVEGAIFGEDPEGTLTGQLLKPVTDATGKLVDWVDANTGNLEQQIAIDTADSKAAQLATEVGAGVVSALPNAVLAMLSGGASTAETLAPQAEGFLSTAANAARTVLKNPQFQISAAQTLGSSYDEAREQGASDAAAMSAAVISTMLNALVEVGGGIETLPGELQNADLSTSEKVLEWVKSALDEGKEEVIQGAISALSNKLASGSDAPILSTTDDRAVVNPIRMAQEGAMGAAVGGILGGGQLLTNTLANRTGKAVTVDDVMPKVNGEERIATEPAAPRNDTESRQTVTVDDVMPKVNGEERIATEPAAPRNDTGDGNPSAAYTGEAAVAKAVEMAVNENGQLNIDNTRTGTYTETRSTGGAENGTELDGTSGTGVRGRSDGGTADRRVPGRSENVGREDLQFSGVVLLSPESQQTLTERGIVNVELHDSSANNAAFSSALDAARTVDSQNGWAVTPKSPEELTQAGTKSYMDRNGFTGFAIASDGDIEAVFANKAAGAPKGATKSTIPQAIALGGDKLDCYGEGLVKLYSKYGFEPVARVQFNAEYANPGWTADKGSPDIYFMVHNGDSADTVVQKMGNYKVWSKAELEALPVMEYDDAYAYRDAILNRRKGKAIAVDDVMPKVNGAERIATEPAAPRNDTESRQTVTVDDVMPKVDNGRNEAMGAADYGFNAYSNYQNTQSEFLPDRANAARQVDIPATDPTGQKTSRFTSNAAGAQVVPDRGVAQIESDFLEGKYGYGVKGDQQAIDKAKQMIDNKGYAEAKGQTVERLQSLKDLKQTVVDAQLLIQQAYKNGQDADAAELLLSLAEASPEIAQGLQAYSIFQKLTPEGQLMGVQRVVKRINEKAARKDPTRTITSSEQTEILHTVDDVRETALRLLGNIADALHPEPDHGVEVENWLQKIGESVANTLSPKQKQQPQLVSKTIRQDLLKFAKDYMPRKQQGAKRAAVDTLRDYFNNREQYAKAWNAAKKAYQAQNGWDTDFGKATIGYNGRGSDPVMMQAIIDEAVAQDLKKRNIDMRTALGDQSGLENQISSGLILQTDATGADATLIRDAVKRYFDESRRDVKQEDVNGRLRSDINKDLKEIGTKISDVIRSDPGDKQAVAKRIADMMVKDYGISQDGANTAAINIVDYFNNMVAEKSQKVLEQMFKDRGTNKKAQKTVMERFSELANLGAFTDGDFNQLASETLFGEGITVDPELAQKFLNAADEDSRAAVLEEIYQDIGSKIPTTFKDIANQWRYTSMLLNPSTHARNIVGNTGQLGLSTTKDALATLGEMGVDWASKKLRHGKGIERTKAFLNLASESDSQLVKLAGQDYDTVARDIIMGGSKYNDSAEGKINQYREIWKLNDPQSKAAKAADATLRGVGKVSDVNSNLMDVEDMWFSRPMYQVALAGYMKANGLTEITDAARAYAVKEAQKSTYRDSNIISDWAKRMGRDDNGLGKVVSFVVNTIFPFKGTPANVGVRAWEYSPAGLLTALGKGAVSAYNGTFNAASFIDDLSAGATGTIAAGIGLALAQNGILKVSTDDQDEAEGYESNSVKLFGYSVPINNLGSVAIPILVGGAIYENFVAQNPDDDGHTLDEFLKALSATLDPVLESSMLTGLQDLVDSFESGDYGDASLGEMVQAGMINVVGNYIASYIPTILSKIANATDTAARKTYVDRNRNTTGQYEMQSWQKKIPGLRQQMTEMVDQYGDTVAGGLPEDGSVLSKIGAAVAGAVSPTYWSKIKTTELDTELRRLNASEDVDSGNYTLLYTEPPKDFEVDGKTVYLTGEQWEQYAKTRNSTTHQIRNDIMDSEQYADLSDDVKAAAMDLAYQYANNLGKASAGVGYTITTKWMNELAGAEPEEVTETIINKAVANLAEKHGSNKYDGLANMLEEGSIEDKVAISLLPDSTFEKWESYGEKYKVPVEKLMDVMAYKASDESKGLKDKNGEDIEGESRQDHVKAWMDKTDLSREQKKGIWYILYAESSCPW